MTPQKLRWVLLGLLCAGIIGFVAIVYTGLSALEQKSHKLVDLKLQDDVAQAQLNSLQQAKKQVAKYGYFKDVAKTVIPSDKDQAQAILDISRFANQAGFLVGSITFPSSNLGGTKPGTAAKTTPTPAASASKATLISQAAPVSGVPGLYSIELTIAPQSGPNVPPDKIATYDKMINFIRMIENNRRTAQIAQVIVQPRLDSSGRAFQSFSFTITTKIFIKP